MTIWYRRRHDGAGGGQYSTGGRHDGRASRVRRADGAGRNGDNGLKRKPGRSRLGPHDRRIQIAYSRRMSSGATVDYTVVAPDDSIWTRAIRRLLAVGRNQSGGRPDNLHPVDYPAQPHRYRG